MNCPLRGICVSRVTLRFLADPKFGDLEGYGIRGRNRLFGGRSRLLRVSTAQRTDFQGILPKREKRALIIDCARQGACPEGGNLQVPQEVLVRTVRLCWRHQASGLPAGCCVPQAELERGESLHDWSQADPDVQVAGQDTETESTFTEVAEQHQLPNLQHVCWRLQIFAAFN